MSAIPSSVLTAFEERLGHSFSQRRWLSEALQHGSASKASGVNYERLEFLGDRVLGLVIAELLFRHYPHESEGALARRLAVLVRRETLVEIASQLRLSDVMVLGASEQQMGGKANPNILADICEALLGAVYLDGGIAAAKKVILPLWQPLAALDHQPPLDPKSALQEWTQARALALPRYLAKGQEGPAHAPIFTIELTVEGHEPIVAHGPSKRRAEQVAATALLEKLNRKTS